MPPYLIVDCDAAPPAAVRELVVTARTPLSVGADNVVLRTDDLQTRSGVAPLFQALAGASLTLNQAQGNDYQPTVGFRGFEASPLAGGSQGLAVYVNGARFNQPFGDTVNLDLLPDAAVKTASLEDADPSFGLNALGGALSVALRSGFDAPGAEVGAQAGGHGWRAVSGQGGRVWGDTAAFVAVQRSHDDGWRRHSPSDLTQVYSDVAWRGEGARASLSIIGADNTLTGNGVAPVQLLAADRRGVFTFPDTTRNRFLRVQADGQRAFGGLDVSAVAYVSRLRQSTINADASDAQPCDNDEGFLCLDGDELLTDPSGAPIANQLDGVPAAQLNLTATRATAYGFTAEAHWTLGGPFSQSWRAGAAFDGSESRFRASSLVGVLTTARGFGGPGVVIDQPDGPISPVDVTSRTRYGGLYAVDVVRLAPWAELTLSARLNTARIALQDHLGGSLNGVHTYRRLNPGVRLDVRPLAGLSAHIGYSEANRAPTPAELSCADPEAPCSLAGFFVSDPNLRQVVARTVSGGISGAWSPPAGRLTWRIEAFRTRTSDEILFVASPTIGRAFFRNAGTVLRQGVEVSADYVAGSITAELSYAYVDATFRTSLALSSPENPEADDDGLIFVHPGDRLPGVPRHRLRARVEWKALPDLTLGGEVIARSGVILQGDEANLTPATAAYATLSLSARWQITPHIELFGQIDNVGDHRYATFGAFSPTDSVPITEAPGAADPRSLAPGAPRQFAVGVRAKF